jgi:hypothetical protein
MRLAAHTLLASADKHVKGGGGGGGGGQGEQRHRRHNRDHLVAHSDDSEVTLNVALRYGVGGVCVDTREVGLRG